MFPDLRLLQILPGVELFSGPFSSCLIRFLLSHWLHFAFLLRRLRRVRFRCIGRLTCGDWRCIGLRRGIRSPAAVVVPLPNSPAAGTFGSGCAEDSLRSPCGLEPHSPRRQLSCCFLPMCDDSSARRHRFAFPAPRQASIPASLRLPESSSAFRLWLRPQLLPGGRIRASGFLMSFHVAGRILFRVIHATAWGSGCGNRAPSVFICSSHSEPKAKRIIADDLA